MRRRAPGPAPARQPRPPAADDVALPAQDRARSDDQPHRRQALRRHRPRKQRQPRPVRPRQTRMSTRPLALSHSELMAQHEDLGVLPPPLPPRQPQQRHGTGDNQEDQLQPHKPKIIPRPGRRRGAEQPAVSGASGQVAQVFGTHRSAVAASGGRVAEGAMRCIRRDGVTLHEGRDGEPGGHAPSPIRTAGRMENHLPGPPGDLISPFFGAGNDRAIRRKRDRGKVADAIQATWGGRL